MINRQPSEEQIAVREILETSLSPIASAFDDPGVTDICIDNYRRIIIYRNGDQILTDLAFESDDDLESALMILANTLGQKEFNAYHPVIDARLPDGSRVAAMHKIASPNGTNATIRIHRPLHFTMDDYIKCGAMDQETADYLIKAVEQSKNIVISGSTGSWKTTLTGILASHIPPHHRVLICEDTNELVVDKVSAVSLEAPVRSSERMDKVDLHALINHTFRRRPDRIIVGEIRYAEAAAAFYRGLTSGHDGMMTTIHARTCLTAFRLIAGYAASYWANVKYDVIEQALKDSINILVHMKKHETVKGLRYIDEMIEVTPTEFETIIARH